MYLGERLVEASLGINNGSIVSISTENSLPEAEKTIDATGKLIIPGTIDVHTHIQGLEYSHRENFISGTQAAASGGVTTFLEMPLGMEDTSAIDAFEMQLDTIKKNSLVDFGIIGAAGYDTIDSIQKIADKGAVAFKTFMTNPPEEEAELRDLAAKNDHFLIEIFSEIAKTGLISSVHAENETIIEHKIEELLSQGKKDFTAHTSSRPAIAEDEACVRAMVLAHHADAKLNLVHMSSKNAFSFIKEAKQKGWNVSCEVTPHHLFLTSEDGEKIGPWAKVDPPLRSRKHVAAAWDALNKGTIDMFASDHSPYAHEEKDFHRHNENIFECGSGMPGIETMLPLMIDAVNRGKITLKRMIEVTSTTPAQRFDIYPQKGVITLNADADLVIIDMRKKYTLKNEDMFTKPKLTVFDGKKLQGKIEATIVRGNVVYQHGEFLTREGHGKFVTPHSRE